MEEFIKLLIEFKNDRAFYPSIAAILIFIVEIIIVNKFNIIDTKSRKVKKAIKLGHVIKAKRVSYWDDDPTHLDSTSYVHAKYIYEVNGKTYKYRYLGRENPPLILPLYYINNPKKTFDDTKNRSSTIGILLYIIPIVTFVLLVKLLG